MKIGLCMVVKDEAQQLEACLDPIVGLFDETVVVDTGSTDETQNLLRQRFGIEPLEVPLEADRCFCLQDARSEGLRKLSTPWVMFLDADERMDSSTLEYLRELPDDPTVAGYFGHWINHHGEEPDFHDYKLFLFPRGLFPMGLVHDNVQLHIRQRGLHASWLDKLVVNHFPDPKRMPHKKISYRQRLDCAIEMQPNFLRYYWFRGYMDFLAGDLEGAEEYLRVSALADSGVFPVECLNSSMVLAEVYARQDRLEALIDLLAQAWEFYTAVFDDFEVCINFKLADWLAQSLEDCRQERLDKIIAPRFAC